jgi:DNA polymerase-3 subunit epsilon
LTHVLPDGRTALAELVERSAQPSIRFEAVGAHFSVKDELRRRRYRWDPDRKVWWKDVPATDRLEEEAWLGRTVYGVGCGARASAPLITELSARQRYT